MRFLFLVGITFINLESNLAKKPRNLDLILTDCATNV